MAPTHAIAYIPTKETVYTRIYETAYVPQAHETAYIPAKETA